jgi:hypothetical protein
MFMIMFVLDDICHLDDVLDSWSDAGISGATIIESSGLYRRMKKTFPCATSTEVRRKKKRAT